MKGKIVAFTCVVVLLFGGLAWASIPDGNGVIHGCYANIGGVLKVVDTDAGFSCGPGETPLTWSQTGLTGIEQDIQIISDSIVLPPGDANYRHVLCPSGYLGLSGGFQAEPNSGPEWEAIHIMRSVPMKAYDPPSGLEGWHVAAKNASTANSLTLTAYAICSKLTSF